MDKEERMDPAAQELEEETTMNEPMDEEMRRAMGILEEPVPIEDEEEESFPLEPALMEVSYVLTEEELAQAFRAVGMYKIKGKRQWIYSALMAIVIAICVALLALVWLVPNLGLKKQAKRAFDPDPKVVRIYKGRIESGKEGNRHFGNIKLGGKNKVDLYEGVYVIQMENHRLIAIPERAIPSEDREKAKALL